LGNVDRLDQIRRVIQGEILKPAVQYRGEQFIDPQARGKPQEQIEQDGKEDHRNMIGHQVKPGCQAGDQPRGRGGDIEPSEGIGSRGRHHQGWVRFTRYSNRNFTTIGGFYSEEKSSILGL
jgi:hypothetical protein